MSTIRINGRNEKIPPYPHHKKFIQYTRQYFFARTPLDHLALGKMIAARETWRGIRTRVFVPRMLILDPTSRCNLHCKGCWAADYAGCGNITLEKLDDILCQAEQLGIRVCFFTGGEPLLRKDDIIRLCDRHRRMSFGAYTNGTLIDEAFADEVARVENLNLFLSIEGWREDTDFRRGAGVFDQVVRAMDILRSRGIAFAFSACYHARNYQTVASREFLDFLQEKGCWFGWLFQYVPVGKDADPALACTPAQREQVLAQIDEYSRRTGLMLIDFWNNGHLAFGCIGAGSGFVHINANGDVEPCAFCHYSDSNIYEKSLAEALQSPFFRRFRQAQPFSENPLSGCPLMNRPDTLAGIVRDTGARSTHLGAAETVEMLAAKTMPLAQAWQPTADRLYAGYSAAQRRNFRMFLNYFAFRKRFTDRDIPKTDR
ncbi:MAG TPA: radical SAM protein [Clostridiales bacterium]|nr:radical SAM protein [Clostridiales bacterium]